MNKVLVIDVFGNPVSIMTFDELLTEASSSNSVMISRVAERAYITSGMDFFKIYVEGNRSWSYARMNGTNVPNILIILRILSKVDSSVLMQFLGGYVDLPSYMAIVVSYLLDIRGEGGGI